VSLLELEVEEIEIDCPKAQVEPPKIIAVENCAKKLYEQIFPGKSIIRVTDGIDTETFETKPDELVESLLSRAQKRFGKEFPYLIYKHKKVPTNIMCTKILESGCLLSAMG